MGDIIKVVPSSEELQIVGHRNKDSWKCPLVGCSYVATKASILGLHKAHAHNFRSKHNKGTENVQYHCPVADCYFNPESERYFRNFQTLRTHYMKIHSEKKFACTKCNKNFGLDRDCHRHEAECGQTFHCLDCGKIYTSRSALQRHCDSNKHQSTVQEAKVKPVKEPEITPKKISKVKRKSSNVIFALPFILPKTTPSQMHSLHIQTDASESQLFLSKMDSDSSINQAVQTVDRTSMTRSAGIQTTFDFQPRNNVISNQSKRLSTGIQTVLLGSPSLRDSGCAGQTRTESSILQKAMTKASIPVVNVCIGTQKSPPVSQKRRKKSSTSTTGNSLVSHKLVYPNSSQQFLQQTVMDCEAQTCLGENGEDFFMSTMSTQTNLSCISKQIFPKLYNTESDTQFQDCHTQTHGQANSLYLDQNKLLKSFVPNIDEVTQTKSHYFSCDQNTQIGNMNLAYLSNLPPVNFVSIQDSQTQTVHNILNSGAINNMQTQTQVDGITNTALVHDQGTSCEGLFQISEEKISHLSNLELSTDNNSGVDYLLGCKEEGSGTCTSRSTSYLTDLLMEVIINDMSGSSSVGVNDSKSMRQDANTETSCRNPSMNTQTFGNLGMDSMTQTIEDLGWEMSTQTVDYLLTDMMTQTSDNDFLEFLTSDSHTQTLEDFCLNLESDECSKFPECSRTSFDKQDDLQGLFTNHVNTQTIWDTQDEILDFHNGSFTSSASFKNSYQESGVQPELYVEKVQNFSKCFNSNVVAVSTAKWDAVLSSSHMTFPELGRVAETETQTIHDPLFYNLNTEDTFSGYSTKKVKYLESAHTQTTYDPMLPSVFSDEDHNIFFNQNIITKKTSSETQTCTNHYRGTAECQTPWDNYLTSVDTSETQTQSDDFFGALSSDIETQTILEPKLITNLELINSFTQTNLHQNTESDDFFDF